jgi:hypothetical protein
MWRGLTAPATKLMAEMTIKAKKRSYWITG